MYTLAADSQPWNGRGGWSVVFVYVLTSLARIQIQGRSTRPFSAIHVKIPVGHVCALLWSESKQGGCYG